MAINRGTRKEKFIYLLETFSTLGILGGAGWGIYQSLGGTPFELMMNAIRSGVIGFIAGSVIGAALGAVAVLYLTIFD